MATERARSKTRTNHKHDPLLSIREEISEIRDHQLVLDQKLQHLLPERSEFLEALTQLRSELMRMEKDMHVRLRDVRACLKNGNGNGKRHDASYDELLQRIRSVVHASIPAQATLAVISRGDYNLLDVFVGSAWHFPQSEDGEYLGHHPGSSDEAIDYLESLRRKGANYLLLPETSFWWLEHYAGFRSHLDLHYQLAYQGKECRIYRLDAPAPWVELAAFVADFRKTTGEFPSILSWQVPANLKSSLANCAVFNPIDPSCEELPYVDESVDVVAISASKPGHLGEAHRVAASAVILIAETTPELGGFQVTVIPKSGLAAAE